MILVPNRRRVFALQRLLLLSKTCVTFHMPCRAVFRYKAQYTSVLFIAGSFKYMIRDAWIKNNATTRSLFSSRCFLKKRSQYNKSSRCCLIIFTIFPELISFLCFAFNCNSPLTPSLLFPYFVSVERSPFYRPISLILRCPDVPLSSTSSFIWLFYCPSHLLASTVYSCSVDCLGPCGLSVPQLTGPCQVSVRASENRQWDQAQHFQTLEMESNLLYKYLSLLCLSCWRNFSKVACYILTYLHKRLYYDFCKMYILDYQYTFTCNFVNVKEKKIRQ